MSTHKRALSSLNPAVVNPSNLKKSPNMGSHKGREGQGARTAFRKAPQASPPETRFTVEVNDFLERFKLLELGLPNHSHPETSILSMGCGFLTNPGRTHNKPEYGSSITPSDGT